MLTAFAWVLVAAWTVFWVVICLPVFVIWRLFRRSSRKEKAAQLRHREQLDAIEASREQ